MNLWKAVRNAYTSRVSRTALRCAVQLAAGGKPLYVTQLYNKLHAVAQQLLANLLLFTQRCHHVFAGQLLVALPVLISYPNFLSKVAWIATINYSAPMYLIAAVSNHVNVLYSQAKIGVNLLRGTSLQVKMSQFGLIRGVLTLAHYLKPMFHFAGQAHQHSDHVHLANNRRHVFGSLPGWCSCQSCTSSWPSLHRISLCVHCHWPGTLCHNSC